MQHSFSLHQQTYLLSSLILQSCPLMVHLKKNSWYKHIALSEHINLWKWDMQQTDLWSWQHVQVHSPVFSKIAHNLQKQMRNSRHICYSSFSFLSFQRKQKVPNAHDLGQDSLHIAKTQACTPVSALLGTTKSTSLLTPVSPKKSFDFWTRQLMGDATTTIDMSGLWINPYICFNTMKWWACMHMNAKNDSVICKRIKPKSTFSPYTITLPVQNISKKPG